MKGQTAFTFVETLACVLILSFSIVAGLGMMLYATVQAGKAQSKVTAMATAQTVAYDAQPLRPGAATWDDDDGDGNVRGWLNGYYVFRSQGAASELGGDPRLRMVSVAVDVYDGLDGLKVGSFTTRLLQGKMP